MSKPKAGMPDETRFYEVQVLEMMPDLEPLNYLALKINAAFPTRRAERWHVIRSIAAKTNTTGFVNDAELKAACEAGDPWLESALRGVAVTPRGCVEVLAYMHSLAHVTAALRIYRAGRRYVTKECRDIAEGLVSRQAKVADPRAITLFCKYYDKASLSLRNLIRSHREVIFTTLYAAWGANNDPQQVKGRPEPSAKEVRSKLSNVDWLSVKRYTTGDMVDANERRGVERMVIDFLWVTGYLPRHIGAELGLLQSAPIAARRIGRPRK